MARLPLDPVLVRMWARGVGILLPPNVTFKQLADAVSPVQATLRDKPEMRAKILRYAVKSLQEEEMSRIAEALTTEPLTGLAAKFARAHQASMEENQPETYRAMLHAGTWAAHERAIGESAEAMWFALMEPAEREAQSQRGSERALGIIDTARIDADSQVMRELVLVPELEDETDE